MNRKSWIILLAAYGTGILATFTQFAVPPVLPALREQFGMSYTQAGMLMSVFAVATLVFATPCGFVIQRHGVRRVGLLGFLLMAAGLGCCLAARSFGVFLAGRAIQGVGFGLVAVSAPTAIGQFLPRAMMPMAMALWSTWIPVGSLAVFFLAPRILACASMTAWWALLVAAMVPGLAAFAWAIPDRPEASPAALPSGQEVRQELANGEVWAAAFTFAAYTFGYFSLSTWASTYLNEVMGLPLVLAASGSMVQAAVCICSNIYGGLLLRRFGHSRWMFLLPPAVLLATWPLFTIPSVAVFCVVMAVFSMAGGILPTIIFASAPLLAKRPEGVGVAMAVVIVGENLGILVGPQVFGMLRDWTGSYRAGFWVMALGSLVSMGTLHRIWRTGVFGGRRPEAPALAAETEQA